MKIFISHSSKNKDYGNALVDLLISVGVPGEHIIFTSNDAYGIPTGKNIFDWLKNRINEKPFVLYLLSPEYYTSVACLNEMGAAWIVENEHTMIFTPNFNLNSYEFNNGALDPREIGFYINNEDRLLLFIESLKEFFAISSNVLQINQRVKQFLGQISHIKPNKSSPPNPDAGSLTESTIVSTESKKTNSDKNSSTNNADTKKLNPTDRFLQDLVTHKLKDEEVLLIHYIRETGRYKLGTGWQESHEIEKIKEWEDIQKLDNSLSSNYPALLRRLEMKKLTEVSELTGYGNPKEVKIVDQLLQKILNLSDDEIEKLEEIISSDRSDEWNF